MIEIVTDKLFHNNTHFQNFNREQFKELLNLTVKHCHFILKGNFYEQIDGVAMGSPLAPVLANVFLSHHETNWLNDCPSQIKPLYYRRYVDDSFILFRSPNHILPFLNYINSRHPNIHFTHQVENSDTLPFLDIQIQRFRGRFSTSVYRKLTFTGLFANFESFIPLVYKKGLVLTLLFRYFNIWSSYAIFHKELENFKKVMPKKKNGFPTEFLDSCVRIFLEKIFCPPFKTFSVPKHVIFLTLPFTGQHSLQIRQQLVKLFASAFPQIQLRIAFKPTQRLSSLFHFKDQIPFALRSRIVYKFKCQWCQSLYIGETFRYLHTRVSEHLRVSADTGKPLSYTSNSSVLAHHKQTIK